MRSQRLADLAIRCVVPALCLIGAIALTLNVANAAQARQAQLAAYSGRAVGTVVQLLPGYKGALRPEITFKDASGTSHTFESDSGQNPPEFNVGDQATVVYDPADPSRDTVDSFISNWGGLLAVSVFAVLLYLVALVGFFLAYVNARFGPGTPQQAAA